MRCSCCAKGLALNGYYVKVTERVDDSRTLKADDFAVCSWGCAAMEAALRDRKARQATLMGREPTCKCGHEKRGHAACRWECYHCGCRKFKLIDRAMVLDGRRS